MPNLRDMIDGHTITAAAPTPKKPSPVAQHVAEHLSDPMGATKDQFQKLQQKKLEYDMAREETQRNLAPVQSVLDQAAQQHGLTVGNNQSMLPGTPGMNQGQPGNTDNPELDENGQPVQGGIPQNMSQTVGKMNSNRPSLAGNQPGVSPGPQESVRPPKLGQAKPGGPTARNSPNAQGNTFNKQAAPPKGSGTMTKSPKNGNGNGKSKPDKSGGRAIKVHVTASATPERVNLGATNRLETQIGLGRLKCASVKAQMRPVGGPSPRATGFGGNRMPSGGGGMRPVGGPQQRQIFSKKVKAGPDSLSDKEYGPGKSADLNPVIRSNKLVATCPKCGKIHAEGKCMKGRGHGTSLGAKKGWSIRNKGHVSKAEKDAHYKVMDISMGN